MPVDVSKALDEFTEKMEPILNKEAQRVEDELETFFEKIEEVKE